LRLGSREWLWHRPDPARCAVRPGDAFVDAGGLEECLPTVRGVPDHGALWSVPWRPDGTVDADGFTLARTIRQVDGTVIADYRLAGEPGRPFIWAAHALLELSPAARLDAAPGTRVRVYDAGVEPWADQIWPLPLRELGPVDGTAVGAVLTDCPSATVAGSRRRARTAPSGSNPCWVRSSTWPPPDRPMPRWCPHRGCASGGWRSRDVVRGGLRG
jgi:hypothetical protein